MRLLVSNVLKFYNILEEIVLGSGIHKQEYTFRLNPKLSQVLVYDMLYGKPILEDKYMVSNLTFKLTKIYIIINVLIYF